MIRIDHLKNNDHVCNPFLFDLVVIDLDDEPGIDSTARDSDLSFFFLFVSRMRWSMFAGVRFRGMCFRLILLS